MKANTFARILAILAAVIFLQTLYFKFTGHPDSIKLFTMLGVEPYGRIGLGIVELITAILLIVPRTTAIGALLGLGIISGALLSHFTVIGVNFNEDGGTLFFLAVVVFLCTATVAWIKRSELPIIGKYFPLSAKA